MPLTPLIHMTAAYSNAVLVAILPYVSDFAKKLDLPVPQPVTVSQVDHFNCSPMKGFVGGGLWLTNGYQFVFDDGYVYSFCCLKDNPFVGDLDDWPHYAGKDHMTTNEAIELARETLRKLGYDPQALHTDGPPQLMQGPYNLKAGYHVPYCEIIWQKPAATLAERPDAVYLKLQINLEKKTLVGMDLISQKFWRDPPKIEVVPELEADYRRTHPVMTFNTKAPAIRRPTNN